MVSATDNVLFRCSWLLAAMLLACGRAEKPAQREAPEAPITTYAQLADAYQNAQPPKHVDLTGVWAETRWIATLAYLSGQNGPDRVLFDSMGLREDSTPGQPLLWSLTFAKIAPEKYSITERMSGGLSVPESVTVDTSGAFEFHPDFGADEEVPYGCRMVRAGRMVCVDAKHPGAGSEFKQLSTTVPPPPPPFCPLAGMSECGGASSGPDARQILAGARVCFHLLYPLTQRPHSSEGTDTWLALGGDSLPAIGAWKYAAVFDDSIVRVAAWRRAIHPVPFQPKSHADHRTPHDSLELRLTFNGTNIRGDIAYDEAALRGTVFAEDTPYSWGVEGERRVCPSSREVSGGAPPRR